MAATKTETRLIAGPYDAVFRAVCDAAVAQGMVVIAADPASGGIQLKTNMTMMTWGENLGVSVRPAQAGTEVTVTSSLKFGLVDWGKNGENIGNMFHHISRLVAGPAGAWHPDPSGRHQLRWYDGTRWTETVSDAGQTSFDAL
jgi:hypothetical protein